MAKKRRGQFSRERIFGMFIVCGVCVSALAFAAGVGVDNLSQLAAGNMADMMCVGGADAKCPCKTGLKAGKCDPKTKGNGKIGCPCFDVTSGDVAASGKCATVGKCQADKADGMMPMLPMLPMPMPKMMMPMMMMPQPCVPKTATTTATTTDAGIKPNRTVIDPSGAPNPDCPPESQGGGGGGFWNPFSGVSNPFASPDDFDTSKEEETSGGMGGTSGSTSVWSKLMESLGLGAGSSDDEAGGGEKSDDAGHTSSSTAQVKSKAKSTNASTTGTDTTDDFTYGKTGSTFTYNEDEIDEEAVSSVLDEIAKILKKLLDIVNGWF